MEKLYVKTSPSTGVTFLLIEKPDDNGDVQWTAIEFVRRVQVVNLRNKAVYALKALRGVRYDPLAPLSKTEQTLAEKASWNIVRRAGGGSDRSSHTIKIGESTFGGFGLGRARALGQGIQYLSEAGAFMWSYHALGFWGTAAFPMQSPPSRCRARGSTHLRGLLGKVALTPLARKAKRRSTIASGRLPTTRLRS